MRKGLFAYRLGIGARWVSLFIIITGLVFIARVIQKHPVTINPVTIGAFLMYCTAVMIVANLVMLLGRNSRDLRSKTRLVTRLLSNLFGALAQIVGYGVLGYLIARVVIFHLWQPKDAPAYLIILFLGLLLTAELDFYADYLWTWSLPKN